MKRSKRGELAFPEEALIEQLNDLHGQVEAKVHELSTAIKAQVGSGDNGPPNETVKSRRREALSLLAQFIRLGRKLQRMLGIPEEVIREIERLRDAPFLPAYDDRYWRAEIENAAPTQSLDDVVPKSLRRLVESVDPDWLKAQARKPYRLGEAYLSKPLHLVGGVRVGTGIDADGPQRFARMLLVCQDHLDRRPDLDFFAAAMLVPEVAALGSNLDPIRLLGPEAERKLSKLPYVADDIVAATIYELLVGAACVRKGLTIEMLAETGAGKVPDYRLTGIGAIPGAVECKRRLGLTRYEMEEASHVERLYDEIRPALRANGIHGSIEASFSVPVLSVTTADFALHVLPLARQDSDHDPVATPWGFVGFRRLPFSDDILHTRLYSPDYLERVFGWSPLQDEWDGLLCEVDTPPAVGVSRFRNPMCLKWRSESPDAITKKARGVTSLWADAVKQIPDGEIGFIYIAYPEGARPAIADARTRHILESATKLWHRWSVRVPVTVISRLYPRALGPGTPDLIESALPGAAEGQEFWLTKVPGQVFTLGS